MPERKAVNKKPIKLEWMGRRREQGMTMFSQSSSFNQNSDYQRHKDDGVGEMEDIRQESMVWSFILDFNFQIFKLNFQNLIPIKTGSKVVQKMMLI
jgi:hypothetical protein